MTDERGSGTTFTSAAHWFAARLAVYFAVAVAAAAIVIALAGIASTFDWRVNREKCGDYGYWHCLIKGGRP